MKIEIGESVLLSWLRHVKDCQIVQMNWKVSPLWELYNEEKIDLVIREVENKFQSQVESKIGDYLNGHHICIFKQNTGYDQILKQAEIDLIGVDSKGDSLSNVYAVDVAFHENGLGYGKNKGENISKVLGKMIRSALVIYGYFNIKNSTVIFATPKIQPGVYRPLQLAIHELNGFFHSLSYIENFDFEFKLYANEEFDEHVIGLVNNFADSVSDTSELYLRSVQMQNLFLKEKKSARKTKDESVATEIKNTFNSQEELPIGKLVKNELLRLFELNMIDKHTVERFTNKENSKEVFGIDFPLFKKITKEMSISEQAKGSDGRSRYWATITVNYGEEEYLICSQWFEHNRVKFLAWLNHNKI